MVEQLKGRVLAQQQRETVVLLQSLLHRHLAPSMERHTLELC